MTTKEELIGGLTLLKMVVNSNQLYIIDNYKEETKTLLSYIINNNNTMIDILNDLVKIIEKSK